MSSLSSLTTIIGPLIFTQLFGWFTGPSAPIVFAGAPYALASVFLLVALLVFVVRVRSKARDVEENA